MSERLLLIAAILLCAAPPAEAQELEQLERRAQVLRARNALLLDSLKGVVERGFEEQPRVTVAGDGFAIAAPEWAVARLAKAAAENAPRWRERYGSSFDALRRDTLVVWIGDPDTTVFAFRGEWRRAVEWRFAGLSGRDNLFLKARSGYDPLADFPSYAVTAWERSLLDSATTAWLGSPVSGASQEGLVRWTRSALLESEAGPAQRCLAGRIEDCERTLGLDTSADSVLRWYDASDSAWVKAIRRARDDIPGRTTCLNGRTPVTCYALLQAHDIRMPRPVSNLVRESFYRFAVEAGGDGAILRFRSGAGRSVAERLSAVAGRPVTELIPEWRVWIDGSRPDESGALASVVMSALGWVVLFALFFAWRFRWIRV